MQAPNLAPALRQALTPQPHFRHHPEALDQVCALRDVALSLKRNGFRVLAATTIGGLPTIEVAAGSLTDELLALDLASHYKWSTVGGVPERWGQFADKPHGVRVIFVERPL